MPSFERGQMDYLAEFVKECQGSVEGVGKSFDKPDDDWLPTVIFRSFDGIQIGGIDPNFFAHPETKDILAKEVLPKLIEKSNATAIAMILSSWMTMRSKEDKDKIIPPSQDLLNPTRREVVVLQIISAQKVNTWFAEIFRDKVKPPTLLKWEDLNDGSTGGRFIEPVQKALQQNVARMN